MLRLDKAENRPKNPPSIFSLDYFSKNGRKKVSEITKLFSQKGDKLGKFPNLPNYSGINRKRPTFYSNKIEDSYQVEIFYFKK